MSFCISRRACADRYSLRMVNSEGKTGKYIWTEYRCPNVVPEGQAVCTSCKEKVPMYKTQATAKCDHGNIGGIYPLDSKLYGSPYYLKQVKSGFFLKPEDETRAKECVEKALSNMPAKKKEGEVKEKKETKQKEKKEKPVFKLKKKEPETTALQFIEEMSPTIYIQEEDVIHVTVKQIKVKGVSYYFDAASGKVYEFLQDGVGRYKGRYNEETSELNTTYPDSDEE